jgi:2-C-methyl-D-erythritol 2,4-cyclodiphosphate synthase
MTQFRVGHGFDVHALADGHRLVLGGVAIDFSKGLVGHSDADVLIHAICDALLGAAGLGDIGRHFPDTNPLYKDADSRELLREVAKLIYPYQVVNIDATVIAQAPKIQPYVPAMQNNLGSDMGIEANRVNIKATTTEKLGFIGRGEGIAAEAVALLQHGDELSADELGV